MELRHIRYFLVLSEELHFTRAADRCGVSQPGLSAAIRKIEAELGGALLQRKPQLQLSDLGRAVRPFWDEALRNVEYSFLLALDYSSAGVHAAPAIPAAEVSLAPVRQAMEPMVGAPAAPVIAPRPADEQREDRGDAIVACLRDRLLVATCRARSAPFAPGDGLADAMSWRGAGQHHASRDGRLRRLMVAALAALIVAAAVLLFGRITFVKASGPGRQAAGAAAIVAAPVQEPVRAVATF